MINMYSSITSSKLPVYTLFKTKIILTCDHPLHFYLKISVTGYSKYISHLQQCSCFILHHPYC